MVKKETAEQYIKDYDFDLFMETSAKTGFNVEELFVQAAKVLLNDFNKFQVEKKKLRDESLREEKVEVPKKQCCWFQSKLIVKLSYQTLILY